MSRLRAFLLSAGEFGVVILGAGMLYDRPVRELLGECVGAISEPFTRAEILSWFRRHYPQIAEGTVAAHIQGLTDLPNRQRNFPHLSEFPPLLIRVGHGQYRRAPSTSAEIRRAPARPAQAVDLVLVGCVKTKADHAMAARDLYRSALFRRRKAYAERSGRPWFIVSSRWGLVEPDEQVAPYDVYLADQPVTYRRAWAAFVTAQLLASGPLAGRSIEIHAGDVYVSALRSALEQQGAVVVDPVDARSMGETLAWYDRHAPPPELADEERGADDEEAGVAEIELLVDRLADQLSDQNAAESVPQFLASDQSYLASAGVYSWWVDEDGARDLSIGLGVLVEAGLIYVGQAGATRRPSGKSSTSTLWSRLTGMHLAERAEFSTFRRTLAAVLAVPLDLQHEDDPQLSTWMTRHLSVVAVPCADRDTLGLLEHALLQRLDPPLNLKGVPFTELRTRLRALRRRQTVG